MKNHLFGSKLKFLVTAFLLLLVGLVLAAPGTAVQAEDPVTVTVTVHESDGITGIDGADVKYRVNGTSLFYNFKTTSAGGVASKDMAPGTYDFIVNLGQSTSAVKTIDTNTTTTVDFQTIEAVVVAEDCDHNPIDGVFVQYRKSGASLFYNFATTSAGQATKELFAGDFDYRAKYKQSWSVNQTDKTLDLTNSQNEYPVLFTLTKVNLLFNGNIKYRPVGTTTFYNIPKYLFPGDFDFKFNDKIVENVAVSGCNFSGGLITLVDEAGNPLASYPVDYPAEQRNLKWKYRCGGSWGPTTSFQTDANGQTFYSIGCSNWDNKITMTLNQTTTEQDVTVNATFQAAKVNANLKSCTGPITDTPGGTVAQGGGYWYTHGTTGPSGTASFYTFPGNIKLRMSYNHASQTLYPTIVAGTNEVDFQTTKVTFNYPGDIKSNKGGSWWQFSKPSMDLLPGDYNFWFKDGASWFGPEVITVAGCEMDNTVALVKLLDSNGDGLAGGTVKYYDAGWHSIPGSTDANGNLFYLIPGNKSNIKFRMTYANASQEKWQNISTNATVVFQTELVTMKLLDSGNGELAAGAKYYAGGWHTFGSGTTTTTMELLPVNYKFRVTYGGASQEKWQNMGSDPNVTFQTVNVSLKLFESDGLTPLNAGAMYYASGWKTFGSGTTPATMELLPVNHKFRVTYGGASTEKWQNVGSNATVAFQTGKVHSDSGTAVQYYAGGWHTFTQDMELLPASYKFRFNDGTPETWIAITAGTTNHIH